MLCLSGFELYSRWAPLETFRISTRSCNILYLCYSYSTGTFPFEGFDEMRQRCHREV